MPVLNGNTCFLINLSLMEYRAALDLQRNLVLARQTGVIENDVVIMLEHPPVFTLGRRAGIENLKASRAFLEKKRFRSYLLNEGEILRSTVRANWSFIQSSIWSKSG